MSFPGPEMRRVELPGCDSKVRCPFVTYTKIANYAAETGFPGELNGH